jgi:hypothetical protein
MEYFTSVLQKYSKAKEGKFMARNTDSLTNTFWHALKNGSVFALSVIVILSSLIFTSCISFHNGVIMIDTPQNIKNDKIIKNEILPYIARALDYNDPVGGNDPQLARIPSVNNMNYDNVVNCQDYALLFYALCKYHNIQVNVIGNLRLLHAYNQIYQGFGTPVDIEPQSGENTVYVTGLGAMHGTRDVEGFQVRINTDPDNRIFDPFNWGDNEQSRGMARPNLELLNYVIANGKLP